jgi:pyrimidine operon attenuation protein/uracil phosphoribosyltransferase
VSEAARAATPAAGASLVMDADAMRRAWTRVAHEILERNGDGTDLVVAGIPTRGLPLARRLAAGLIALGGRAQVLALPVDAHRDDRARPSAGAGAAPPGAKVAGRVVVLVDDVIFHGRTARAALDALTELGRPRAVQLAVMVDRGHRELPIRADFVGKNIPTSLQDRVEVHLSELDDGDGVYVVGQPAIDSEGADA